MGIIIPSKNIFKVENQKVIKNKINAVDYSYDNITLVTKEQNYSYDIWNREDGLNKDIKTITHGNRVFVEVEIVLEDFYVNNSYCDLYYPSTQQIDTENNNYGFYVRAGSKRTKPLEKKLVDNDPLLSEENGYIFLFYREVISRYKTILTCYFWAGSEMPPLSTVYIPSAQIFAYYTGADINEISVSNNAKFSLTKNELMQNKTVYNNEDLDPMYEVISGKVINSYKNGKETAKILCSISDYYNEDGSLAISAPKKLTEASNIDFVEYTNNGYWVPNAANYEIAWFSDISRHNFDIGTSKIKLVPNDGENWHYGTVRVGDNELAENCSFFVDMDFGKEYAIKLKKNQNLYFHFNTKKPSASSVPYPDFHFDIFVYEAKNMCFDIGAQVIPMVFGADGKDRPMSRYSNGKQKVFNVLGRKMIYDGAVWQELTLQEKTQSV